MNSTEQELSRPWTLRTYIGGSLLALSYVALLVCFAELDVWRSRFFEGGSIYLAYHALRAVFLVYFVLVCATAGRLILTAIGAGRRYQGLDGFLVHSYLGAAALLIGTFLLGVCMLYYKPLAIALTTPFVFLSFPTLVNAWQRRGAIVSVVAGNGYLRGTAVVVLAVAITGLVAFHLMYRGLNLDLNWDPVDHYAPNYRIIMEQHGLRPNTHYLQFFYTKGAGLHYLGVLLTDLHSFQLVSYFMNMLAMLSVFRLVQLFTGGQVWPLFAAVVFLTSGHIRWDEYHKVHVAMGSLIAFLCYFFALWLQQAQPLARGMFIVGVVQAAVTIMAPPSLIFTLPLLTGWLVLQRLYPSKAPLWQAPLGFLAPSCAFALSCFINYAFTGIFEFTPHQVMPKFNNPLIMQDYVPKNYLAGYIQVLGNEGSVSGARLIDRFSLEKMREIFFGKVELPGKWYAPLLASGLLLFTLRMNNGWLRRILLACSVMLLGGMAYAALKGGATAQLLSFDWLFKTKAVAPILLAAVLLYAFWSFRRNPSRQAVLLAMMSLMIFFLVDTVAQQTGSVARFFGFKVMFQIVLYVWLLWVACRLAAGSRARTALVGAVAAVALWFNFDITRGQAREEMGGIQLAMDFMTGKRSFADRYNSHWNWMDVVKQVRDKVGAGVRVQCLNWPHFFGAYNISDTKFFFHPNFFGDMDRVLSGSPALARELLEKKYNVQYFLADLADVTASLGSMAYTPLFAADSIERNFKVVARFEPNFYLLTWRHEPAKPGEMTEVVRLLGRRNLGDFAPLFGGWYEDYQTKGMMAIDRRMWDVTPPMPRVAFFSRWAVAGNDAIRTRMVDPKFDPRSELNLENEPGFQPSGAAQCSTVPIDRSRRGLLEAHVNADCPGLVFFHEEYSSQWRAKLGDKDVPVLRANGKYMAVAVPPGQHRLTFQFKDTYLGRAVKLFAGVVGGLGLLSLGVFCWERRRRGRSNVRTSTVAGLSYASWEASAGGQTDTRQHHDVDLVGCGHPCQ